MPKIIRYPEVEGEILDGAGLHPVLRRIYLNRGITSAEELQSDLSGLLSYKNLLGIDAAVSCLFDVLKTKGKILVVGDYDVDGATSTVLMVEVLKKFGAESVEYIVPDRFEEGYGLGPEIIELAKNFSPDLIVTVDNGISSVEGVRLAKAAGIKVVITDHHLAPSELPVADAIVNPNLAEDKFSSKHLAGVGVAFYVLLALRAKLREANWFVESNLSEPNLADYLDLVALGTIADMMTLDKNNRILVKQGLRRIRAGRCHKGIKAIITRAGRSIENISASDFGFVIAPRLNAAGRLQHMSVGIDCLLATVDDEALQLAGELESLNEQRKAIEKEMRVEAGKIVRDFRLNSKELPLGLCLHHDDWHQGVVGILASKMKDRFNRPVAVFANHQDDFVKGSARSIGELHIRNLLERIASDYPELITKFGGHAMAAGITVPKNEFHRFRKVFDKYVREKLADKEIVDAIQSDGELSAHEIDIDLAETLQGAGPWGSGFAEPVFDGKFKVLDQRLVGGHHLKMTLEADGKQLDAIAFNIDPEIWPNERVMFVHLAYRLDINEFRGRKNVQLVAESLEAV